MIRRAYPADHATLVAMMLASNGYDTPPARAMITAFASNWTFTETDEVWVEDGEGGALLGFYQLIPHGDADQELDLFFTANAAQGQGVGRRLFDHMANRARGLGASQLLISSNPRAADFYQRMGARLVGVSPPVGDITWERPKLVLHL